MATDRMFTRFSRHTTPPRIDEIPEGGFCLSAFLVISQRGRPGHVLLGRLNPDAPWDHLGALDPERAERNAKGWMLPASHLILNESPTEAAARILREMLSLKDQPLEGPRVFSEVYGPKNHWDLEFVFLGERGDVPRNAAWTELRFVDLAAATKDQFSRAHEDILASVEKWRPR